MGKNRLGGESMHVFPYGEKDIPLKYKPNPRAKRLSLRLSVKDASLVLTVPPRATSSQITAFLQQSALWVENQLPKLEKTVSLRPGDSLFIFGTTFHCVKDPLRKKPVLCHITQTLRLPSKLKEKDLYSLFKKKAEDCLVPYLEEAVRRLGQRVEKITIKDPRSRWGSCSARKTISLSWRLVLAPPEVAQYVCVHEAAHLLHMNHSKTFWRAVGELCPAYRSHKKWLKLHGPRLMRFSLREEG